LSGALERLSVDKKIQQGEWLLKRLKKPSESVQSWWALGRIGSRILFHGSDHFVIPPERIESWLQQCLTIDWKKVPQAGFAATLMTRMTGDRSRDVSVELREKVVEKLKFSKSPATWINMITQITELDEQQEKQIFGESLPPGLKLLDDG